MLVSVYAWIRRCVCVCVCLIVFEGRPSRCVVIVLLDVIVFFECANHTISVCGVGVRCAN